MPFQVEVCNPEWKVEPGVYPTRVEAHAAAIKIARQRGLGTGSYRIVLTPPLTLVKN